MPTTEVAKKNRKATDVLTEIEQKLGTVDGIATADAFQLGGLVREYGDLKKGEAAGEILLPLLDAMSKPKKGNTDEPWKGGL